jgi:DEAD/DEAH box helicase domain-containing protein
MNFNNFFHKTQNRLKDSILSLWATGDAGMQQYFSAILDKEGLIAEPVFQTAFPWEPADVDFGNVNQIFNDSFIERLDAVKNEEYRFPKERKPYKHQIQSWDFLINQNKSIAVTTGTGSGKTECFMLPVLYDIFSNYRNSTGINAIFLYPLNALIGSQKKRVDAWCRALGGINYAVYNGNTEETASGAEAKKKLPELISRKQIRETPPQILFTNPAMLEYILVRNKDVDLLKNSQGSLRWILLDEAHTLTGSAASEMALLIRRVVDALKVDVRQLRFAITSATVGTGEESQVRLKHFMANLCGISQDSIVVITGERVLSQKLPPPSLSAKQLPDIFNTNSLESYKEVQQLREDILSKNALTLSEIGKRFPSIQENEQLKLMDLMSERKIEGDSILPLRGHFFVRGIGGVYVCTNPECTEHKEIKSSMVLGTMTTIAGNLCKCGFPLLELVACRSCGNQLLEAEKTIDRKNGDEILRMISAVTHDAFLIENPDEEEEDNLKPTGAKFCFTKRFKNSKYIDDLTPFSISSEGKITHGIETFVESDDGCACPYCGESTVNPIHFRLSSSFINRILADIFLEETPEAEIQTQEMLWKGHKYISFTDSRQGTAKISALINQDNEASWLRSQVYHKLCEKAKEWRDQNPEISKEELNEIISQIENELATTQIPVLKANKQKDLEFYKAQLNNTSAHNSSVSLPWTDLKNYLVTLTDFRKLFEGTNPHDTNPNSKSHYLTAILYDQFARRLPRERSLENLGMVSLVYQKLQHVNLPSIAEGFGITLDEWKSLLKIAVDYLLRYSFHFFVSHEIYPYSTSFIRSQTIYNPDAEQANVKRWPTFEKNNIRQNRLSLLLCAGLGYHERGDIDAELEDRINELLQTIWRTIKSQILSIDGDGYKLNLEEVSQFQLSKTLWLCPVKRRLIDAQFKGYSPWIKGNLTADNIRHYKIEKSIQFPEFPYPFNIDDVKNSNLERTRQWIYENIRHLREEGVWNNLHEQIILNHPFYLSGEHSAQQNEKRLKDLEGKFEKSEINILNCSTTMEMGVDIGGISTVVMNNVPPSPANYLQRAGRAGRRAEAKSLAFTICSPNPVGLNAMADPMWALSHRIAPPYLSFRSEMVVERHVNAFFLGKFVQTEEVQGLNIKDNVQSFFFKENNPIAILFSNWILTNSVHAYESTLSTIVKNTPLEGKSFLFLLNKTVFNFQKLSNKTVNKKNGFEEKLSALAGEFGDQSPAYKAVLFQKNKFLEKNAIGYLAEEGFLPSAGLPTGIVEFDTLNIDDLRNNRSSKSKPSYFITRALSEFAPGNQIVLDGKSYTSEGIILKNDRGVHSETEIIQSCSHCGYQRIVEVANNNDIDSKCPHCEHNSFVGINFKNPEIRGSFTEMIQPAGFAVDIYQSPSRKINEVSNIQYVDPLLINVKPWQTVSTALFDSRDSEGSAEILFYNVGSGNGYAVCLHCGRTANDKDLLAGHKRLRGGKNKDNEKNSVCSGNDSSYAIHQNVILGGRFKTDFCEMRFKDENNVFSRNESLLYTLGAVLSKELSHFLAVEESEIKFGIKKYDQFSSVFIFDTAKGGAGYASQFTLYSDEIFKIAKEKLSQCNCDKACTRCLIDRNTQWHMDKLDRNLALSWLERAMNLQVPNTLLSTYTHLKTIIGSIKEEIGRMSYANKIKEIWLYGSSDVQSWEIEKLKIIDKLRNKVKINLVLDSGNNAKSNQEKISLIQLAAWTDIWKKQESLLTPLKTVCKILTEENNVVEYLAEDFEKTFNENWGNAANGFAYKNPNGHVEKLQRIEIKIDEQSVFETSIDECSNINSNEIVDLLLNKSNGRLKLKSLMQNQIFDVEYTDRYLKTPFGCILMVQFIDRFSGMLGFNINSFTFNGQDFSEDRFPRLLFHNFKDANDRNNAIIDLAGQLEIPNLKALNHSLPHYRYFEFKNKTHKIIIRPDAGIEYGWFLSENFSKQLFNDRTNSNDVFKINKKENSKLLYTISIEEC